MSNRAYLSLWTKGFHEETMLEQFERLLGTIPFSATRPGFASLVIRAVDPAEAPVTEHDLRGSGVAPAEVVAIAREWLHADCACEVQAWWDIWSCGEDGAGWGQRPEPIEIYCHGPEYDGGISAEAGDFQADVGWEHFFTGHGRLLGRGATISERAQDPVEAGFLAAMAQPGKLREYEARTRENIRRLTEWVRKIEEALPVERYLLWSEGEENLETRLDEILASR